jgi:hypothetical protein
MAVNDWDVHQTVAEHQTGREIPCPLTVKGRFGMWLAMGVCRECVPEHGKPHVSGRHHTYKSSPCGKYLHRGCFLIALVTLKRRGLTIKAVYGFSIFIVYDEFINNIFCNGNDGNCHNHS